MQKTKLTANKLDDYATTQFEDLGFFIEYLVGNKLIGTKNIDSNPTGEVGYASTRNHVADETITFKRNKKIKKGTSYQTRVYPMCGKVINK